MSDAAAARGAAKVVTVVDIYTDGACSGNPGPGGWGAILRYGTVEKELCGGEPATTNNRMELMAAIQALEALKRPVKVAPSHRQPIRAGRHHRVDSRLEGARLADRRQEAGQERGSVEAAGSRQTPHDIELHWVRGHAGHPENERADELARKGLKEARQRG